MVVRRIRGEWRLAAIRPGGKPEGTWALPKGLVDDGEDPAATALREVQEETGLDGRLEGKLGDVKYVYTWDGERIFKIVSFFLVRATRGRIGDLDPALAVRGGRGALAPARRGAPPAGLPRRARDGRARSRRTRRRRGDGKADLRHYHRSPLAHKPSMYALNFYSPMVADQLRSRRKTATIRLGDKSGKYKKGMVVQVLVGTRFGPREKIFEAVIDKVEVKDLMDLSPREIEHDNPEIRRPEEMLTFLSRLYNREIAPDATVTVIHFSEILNPGFAAFHPG